MRSSTDRSKNLAVYWTTCESVTRPRHKLVSFLRAAIFFFGLFLLTGILGGTPLWSQAENTGTVTGRVTDKSGAVVRDATVVLSSKNLGFTARQKTNTAGEYTFNSVPVGSYSLYVNVVSFSEYVVTGINVNAQEHATEDAVLVAGSISNTVIVAADDGNVDTTSATIGLAIDQSLVRDLPIDGNNVVALAALLPGVTDVNAPTTFTNDQAGPTYNASGARSNQNLLLLDGTLWNNLSINTGLNFPPGQTTEQVSVLLNNFKAEYGRNVGSVFNILTKSGTEVFHGQFWEYAQNSAFNAADYLSHANPHLVQNQFGVTIGGPIVHNKLYFFFGYQDLRLASTVTAQSSTPTLNERGLTASGTPRPCITAAFSVYSCATLTEDIGTGYLVNPLNQPPNSGNSGGPASLAQTALQTAWQVAGNTGTSPCVTLLLAAPQQLPNAEIPSVCINPIVNRLFSRLPVPQTYLAGSTLPYAVSEASQPRNDMDFLGRMDFNWKRHRDSARYYRMAPNDLTANGVSAGTGVASYEVNRNTGGTNFGSIDDIWVVTPNILNTMRLAYKRYIYDVSPTDASSISTLGALYSDPNPPALPYISVATRFNVGTSTANYVHSVNEDIELDDQLAVVHGKHNFQFGSEYLRLQYLKTFAMQPSFSFGNDYTNVPMADYLFGLPSTVGIGNGTSQAAVQHDLYVYAQDDWRAMARLTISYGVRYELPMQWYQPKEQAATFIPGYKSVVFPQAPLGIAFAGDPGIDRSLVGTDYKNVAPRFGFAYDIGGKGHTAIRGGFGLFYDAINAMVVGVSEPFHYQATIGGPAGGLSEPLLGQNPVPPNYSRKQDAQFTTPYSITFPDAKFRTPYTEAFNIGFQRLINKRSSFEMDYVGRAGRHLALGFDLNPAIYDCSGAYFQANPKVYCTSAINSGASYQARVQYPNFNYGGSGVLDYMTVGSSSYNGLFAVYVARFKILNMIASYVYAKSMDDSSNGTSIQNSSDQPTVSIHNGISDFNATHVLNLGFTMSPPKIAGSFRAVRAVLNDWTFSGIYNARTGHPFSVYNATDSSLQAEPYEYVSFTAGGYHALPSNRHRMAKVEEWFNTSDVCNPPRPNSADAPCPYLPGHYGNAPRNYFIGPAFIMTNLGLQRRFALDSAGRVTFSFRLDAFNAFNTPNLGMPYATLSGSQTKNQNFGRILATAGSNGAVGTNGRRLQLTGAIRF